MSPRLLFLVLTVSVALAGKSSAAPVKVGFINSTTGAEAPIGENLSNGVALALEDLRKKGIEVQLLREDDTGKPQISVAAFEKLVAKGVAGVVGPYTSACASAVSRVAEKHRVPLLIPVAAREEITQQGFKWVYRLNATADQYASSLVDAALSLGAPKTIAFIYENTDFGTSTVARAREYVAKKGLRVVAEESYPKGSSDFRPALSRIKAQNADLVFMVSYVADAILLMRQGREMALQPQAFLGGGAGFTTVHFANQKEISNYVFSCTQWTDDVSWPGAKEFATRYKARFGKEPTYHAACAYASMMIMAETASRADGDREKTRLSLKAGKWSTIMGEVQFVDFDGHTNQNRHQMLVQQIQGGRYETVYPPHYATKKAIYPFPKWK